MSPNQGTEESPLILLNDQAGIVATRGIAHQKVIGMNHQTMADAKGIICLILLMMMATKDTDIVDLQVKVKKEITYQIAEITQLKRETLM